MSQSSIAASPYTHDEPSTGVDVISIEDGARDILTAFDDVDCRGILETITESDERLSASEVSERCGVPLSTTYRKLELLTDAGILSQHLRIRRSGKHASEYTQCIDDVRISVDADAGIELHVSRCSDTPRSMHSPIAGDC